MSRLPPAILLAGPTCSGKSALALDLAERLDGIVINADSMQIYNELRVLTARPTPADEARAPHALYGVRLARLAGTAAWWRGEALAVMRDTRKLPILCGGTGLYFAALTEGLADIPDPGQAARDEARHLLAELGPQALHQRLVERDPATAGRLRPGDRQRIARAWEVLAGTGVGLAAWHARQERQDFGWDVTSILIDPPRAALRAAIAARFGVMLDQGACAEVEALLAQQLDPSLPAMRAHGVPELAACLRGEISLTAARARAENVTFQYTKRQATWFRHRFNAGATPPHRFLARYVEFAQDSERFLAEIIPVMRGVR